MDWVVAQHVPVVSVVEWMSCYGQIQTGNCSDFARTHLPHLSPLRMRNRKTSLKFKNVRKMRCRFSDCKKLFKNALGGKRRPRVGHGPEHTQMTRGENRTDHRNNRICISSYNWRTLCGPAKRDLLISPKILIMTSLRPKLP